MCPSNISSLQGILKQRQKDEFVGREDYLTSFQQNIKLPYDNELRRFIYSIFGQGGVGKTSLLRRFWHIVESAGAMNAKTDDIQRDVPMVMAHLAEQFEQKGHELKNFSARYKTYREKRQELETDPEAPQGFPSLIGRAIAKGGIRLARRIPVGGAAFELVEEDAVATLMGDVATYVARRLTNKDEVQLVLEPVEVLTPLFIKDLQKIAEKHFISLFFDTYERTGVFLDSWLRDVLEGRYGQLPINILFVLAGQHELDRNNWAPYEGLISRISLDVFSEEEAIDYLKRKGIEDKEVSNVIIQLSGRLPLLVATLASESPKVTEQINDPTDTAIKRFLKWVEDAEKRHLALNAALPRRLNQDAISIIIEGGDPDALFLWLKSMPFVLSNAEGWGYHNVVRELMLRHKRHEAYQEWLNLHKKLADYYESLQANRVKKDQRNNRDHIWQVIEIEKLYHRLCEGLGSRLAYALNGFIKALNNEHGFAQLWAETMVQSGKDAECIEILEWGTKFVDSLRQLKDKHYNKIINILTTLLEHKSVEASLHHLIISERGFLNFLSGQEQLAVNDLTEAIELKPTRGFNFYCRGLVYEQLEQYENALNDLNRAYELLAEPRGILLNRGMVYRKLGKYEEAISDLRKAVEEKSVAHRAYKEIALSLMAMQKPQDAADAFVSALKELSDCVPAWRGLIDNLKITKSEANIPRLIKGLDIPVSSAEALWARASALGKSKYYEEALAEFNELIDKNPQKADWFSDRGRIYSSLERYDKAELDYARAIALDDKQPAHFANRGAMYGQLRKYEEALKDFNEAIELGEKSALIFVSRGQIYSLLNRHGDALSDFEHALSINDKEAEIYNQRGRTYTALDYFDKALEEFEKAISLDATKAGYFVGRGVALKDLGRYEDAIKDFEKSLTLNDKSADAFLQRGITYRMLGKGEESLTDIRQSINLKPSLNHQGYKEIGKTLYEMGLYQKAVNSFEKALKITPDCFDCWTHLARVFKAIHSSDRVANLLRSIKVPEPKSVDVILARGLAMKKIGLKQAAVAEFGRALAYDSNNVPIITARADAYSEMGLFDEALKAYQRAIDIDSTVVETLNSKLGLILNYMNKYEEAIEHFTQSIRKSGDHVDAYNLAVATFRWRGLPYAQAEIDNATLLLKNLPKENYVALYGIGGLEALVGNTEQALTYLAQAIKANINAASWATYDPAWLDLKTDARFQALVNENPE